MLLLGIDAETTGLDPEKDRVIECGTILWDTDLHRPIKCNGFFIKPDIEISDEAWAETEKIHHIPRALVEKYGASPSTAIDMIARQMAVSAACVAHNGSSFDKPFFENMAKRCGKTLSTLWVDTRLDVPTPLMGNLVCLAAQHNFLNPFAHSAIFDAMSMLKILDCYDISKVIERAKEPNITVCAWGLSFEMKDLAKNRGYYWEKEPIKLWLKKIKLCDLKKEEAEAGFKVKVYEE